MLNASGLVPLRFENVEEALATAIQREFGGVVDLSVDALMGIYADVFGITETELWELSQGVYDSTNLLSAEAEMLDNLALLVGIVRLPATYTRGVLWIGADDGTVVPSGSLFQSVLGDYFLTQSAANITVASCLRTDVYINSVIQNESYTLTVNGNVYYRAPTAGQTQEQIFQFFYEELQADGAITTTLIGSGETQHLTIQKVDQASTMNISGTSYFGFRDVVCPVLVAAEVIGDIPANANTIRTYIPETSNLTLNFVTNPYDLVRGTAIETDEALRQRVISSYTAVAGSSPDSIQEAVAEISGVDSVKVVENITTTTNSRGMPPKSFQVIVHNGDDRLIAEAIWKKKPAGIHCYADRFSPLTISVDVLDYNSQSHLIRFIRPTTKYVWVYCEYTKYSEELFPESGELIMKEELANFGKSLGIGNDVIPDRFYPAVYRNVKGVDDLELYFAITSDLNTVPTYPADYTQSIITITDEQITNFSSTRVQTAQV